MPHDLFFFFCQLHQDHKTLTFLICILPEVNALCIPWHGKPVSVVGKVAVKKANMHA